LIPIISHPRSGSTYLMRLIAQASNVATVMEPFHPYEQVRQSQILSFLQNSTSVVPVEMLERASQLANIARSDCHSLIKQLCILSKQSTLSFKLFPGHLPARELYQVFEQTRNAVFLRRNLVHAFISDTIASDSGRYTNIDNSDVKIQFEPMLFKLWAEQKQSFLSQTQRSLSYLKVPFQVIDYELLLTMNEKSVQNLLMNQGLTFDTPLKLEATGLKKQDNRTSVFEKVSNPETVRDCLREFGWHNLADSRASMAEVV